jgi:MoaA/NifB/PqqE/SkfB family radical SAM enzyme
MNKDQLKKTLDTKFNVVSFVDLAHLTTSPSAAYHFFKNVYQTEYSDSSRIVLYSSFVPSTELIKHIYNVVELVDISCYFIMFCIPPASTKTVHQLDSDIEFQYFYINLEETIELSNKFFLPKTICAFPWSHIEIKHDGTISHCCNGNYNAGNIIKDTLKNTFDNKFVHIRNDLLTGKKPKECASCWKKESQGVTSIREYNAKRLIDSFLGETLDNPKIKSLDIKFQNTCNFKCLICNSQYSSLHAQEQYKHLKIPLKTQVPWSESESFLNQVNDLLPSLTNIDMTGGEPFLIKNFKTVLQSAVERGLAKNIRLHYNTNGSVWPEDFINYWKHFKEIDIHFSIDAIGNQFEYQRGGSWHEVESNILKLKNLNYENIRISVMPAISILNVYYLDQVVDWATKNNFPLFAQYVYNPTLALNELTQQAKDMLNEKYKSTSWNEVQKILELINSIPPSDGKKFCTHIQWYDTIRKTNFANAHKEMAHAMGYLK